MSTYYNSVFGRHISYGGMEKQAFGKKLKALKALGEKALSLVGKGKGKAGADLSKTISGALDDAVGSVSFQLKPSTTLDSNSSVGKALLKQLQNEAESAVNFGDDLTNINFGNAPKSIAKFVESSLPGSSDKFVTIKPSVYKTIGDDAVFGTFSNTPAAEGLQVSLPWSNFTDTGLKPFFPGIPPSMPSGAVNLGRTTHLDTLIGSGLDDAIARTVDTNPVFATYVGGAPAAAKASLLSRLLNHLPDKQTQLTLAALAPLYGHAGYDIYKDIADDDDKD